MSSSTVLIATPYGFNGNVVLPWNSGGNFTKQIHNLRETLHSDDCSKEAEKVTSNVLTTFEVHDIGFKEVEKKHVKEEIRPGEITDPKEKQNISLKDSRETEDTEGEEDDDDEYEDIDDEDDEDDKTHKMSTQVSRIIATRKSSLSKISKAFDSKQNTPSVSSSTNKTSRKNKTPSPISPPAIANGSKHNQNLNTHVKYNSSKNKTASASLSTVGNGSTQPMLSPAKQTIKRSSASSSSAERSGPTSPTKQTSNIKRLAASSPTTDGSKSNQIGSSLTKQTSNVKKASESSPAAEGNRLTHKMSSPAKKSNNIKQFSASTPSENESALSPTKQTSNIKSASTPSTDGSKPHQNLCSPAKQTSNIKSASTPTADGARVIHNLCSPVKQTNNVEKPNESPPLTDGNRPSQNVPSPAKQNFTKKSSASVDENQQKQNLSTSVKQTTSNIKKPSVSPANDGSGYSLKVSRDMQSSPSERLLRIRDKVEQAIRDHKIFTMYAYYPTIREALKQRGWVEKEKESCQKKPSQSALTTPLDDGPDVNTVNSSQTMLNGQRRSIESMLTYRLLRNVKPDFVWAVRSDPINWQEVTKKQLINRFPRAYFTTKVGLCNYLKNMHWYCEEGVSRTLFPRCYNICHSDEMSAFRDDFRLTACISLLKWLIFTYLTKGESAIKSTDGKVPFTAIEFAIARCSEYVTAKAHEDIDKSDPIVGIWDHQWDQFLTWYYMVLHNSVLFAEFEKPTVQSLYEAAKSVLAHIKKYWPQYDLDGMYNIWIVKPGAKSRGRGIQLMNKLEKILEKINPAVMKESRYVVQKYIERPLLIYDTKFDIRQWFLVTCAQPLTIWMYKESYLRFCSQPFSLRNFHESIHLCNNSIQRNYKNGARDAALPDENMWDCYTFQTYLRAIGHADMWEKCIYPGMRESIICALLSAQEHMDRRKNCFELFGADFMLTEDFSPWLIEINSCPCMAASTSVTARMCAQCLEDVIKVVVDRRNNSSASTGMFELIYRQRVPKAPPYLGMSLAVKGTKILKNTILQKQKKESPRESPAATASPSTVSSRSSSIQGRPASRNSLKESPPAKSPVTLSSSKGSPEVKSPKVRSPTIKNSAFCDYSNSASENDRYYKRFSEFTGPVIVDMLGNLTTQAGRKKKTPARKRKITRKVPIRVITEKDVKAAELKISDPNFLIGENHFGEKLLHKAFGEKEESELSCETDTEEDEYGHSECSKIKKATVMDESSTEKVENEKSDSQKDLLSMEDFEIKKKQMCVMWKNSNDAEKSIQFFNEWKHKLDHTRASCEDMLYKLKMFKENESLKPKYYTINKEINWESENANKPTISDILQKLSQTHPEREVFVFKNTQQLAELESHHLKRKPCYLNMLIDESIQYTSRRSQNSLSDQSPIAKLPSTSQFYNSSTENDNASIAMRGILPRIRQKTKFANSNSLRCNGKKLDNFYAIGMNLKSLQAIHNQKGHLVLPLQSENNALTPVITSSVN